jgi:uncharacterized protein (DUF433 family)
MVGERGGLETARVLLHSKDVSEGYTALWERGRLDLTVERLILNEKWHALFTNDERDIARKRLESYKYDWKGEKGVLPDDGGGAAKVLDRITVNPKQCGGKPCIRGMRIRVADVLGLLAHGLSPEQVLKQLPDLEAEDIRASLEYAAREMDQARRASA